MSLRSGFFSALRFPLRLLLVVCIGLVAGCGPSGSTGPTGLRPVRLTLNAMAGGQQAGFLTAHALGYYAAEGLDVTIDEGRGSRDTAERVADGRTDFGYADPLTIVQTRAAGQHLTVVSTIFQTSGYEILSLQSRAVGQPGELRGTTIGATSGTPARLLLDVFFGANHIDPSDVTVVDVAPVDLVSAVRSGRVSAIVGSRDFQALQLRDLGENVVELPYADAGVPLVGLSIAASDELIRRDPQLVAGFVRASLRGWDAARRTPDAAARAVLDQFLADYEGQILTQLQADLPLLCGPENAVLGMPSAAGWRTTLDLYSRAQLLSAAPPIADFVTSRFIGPDAPTCPL